jgi:hypothetical protein
MYVGRALLCLVASPLLCAALATSIRGQGSDGPISIGGPIGGGDG